MKLVIDTNIVFSALLSSNNRFHYLFYNKSFKFFTCNFLFVEIFKNKEKLMKISCLNEEQLLIQIANIFSKIKFIPEQFIPKNFYQNAYKICKKIDEKDTPFLALSVFLNIGLLTGDKKLYNGLIKKGYKNVYTINELLKG